MHALRQRDIFGQLYPGRSHRSCRDGLAHGGELRRLPPRLSLAHPPPRTAGGKGVERNYIRRSALGVLSPLPAFHQPSGSARVTHRTMNASIQPPSIDLDLAGSTMRKTMRTPTRRGAKGSSTPQDCRSRWARSRIAKPRSAYGKAPHSASDTLLALSPHPPVKTRVGRKRG